MAHQSVAFLCPKRARMIICARLLFLEVSLGYTSDRVKRWKKRIEERIVRAKKDGEKKAKRKGLFMGRMNNRNNLGEKAEGMEARKASEGLGVRQRGEQEKEFHVFHFSALIGKQTLRQFNERVGRLVATKGELAFM